MKVLVLDLDGVVIKPSERFSARLARKYQIAPEKVGEFFKNEFDDCLIGRGDLKERISKYLLKWNWQGSITELLAFWFQGERELNDDILSAVRKLRKKSLPVFIATNNEKYRVEYVKKEVGLAKEFDGIYASAQLGCLKPEMSFFAKVTELIKEKVGKVAKEDVYYSDDTEENVAGAKKFGWQAYIYHDFEDFSQFLAENFA